MPATKKQNAAAKKCTHMPDQNMKGSLRRKSRIPAFDARTTPSRMQSAAQINISNPATTNAKAAKRGAEADTIAAVNIGAISSAKLLIIRVRFMDLTRGS